MWPRFGVIFAWLNFLLLSDLIIVNYFPKTGKLNNVRVGVMKFHRAVVVCWEGRKADCLNATDEVLKICKIISGDVWMLFDPKTRQEESAIATQRFGYEAKKKTLDFTKEAELMASGNKAQEVINSLRFSRYDENNFCNLMEGIPPEVYEQTVDEMADLTSMPPKLRKKLKTAKRVAADVTAIDKLNFTSEDGGMVFGRIAVIQRGKVLDMAYSLHSVDFELTKNQPNEENAKVFGIFSNDVGKGGGDISGGISLQMRREFKAFFHKQAIQGFVKQCDYLLTTIKNNEVVQALGVEKDKNKENEEAPKGRGPD